MYQRSRRRRKEKETGEKTFGQFENPKPVYYTDQQGIVEAFVNWTEPGDKTFVVVLRVVDNDGGEDTASISVTVAE